MLLRRHDRYVARSFWITFLAVVFFFTLIVLVLDSAERLRRLTRNWEQIQAGGQHPLLVLGEYYATLLPFLWMKLLPFCVPAAAAFCVARLIRHNELTPLVTTGVSMRRTVRPIVMSGVVIVGGMLLLQETLIPSLSRHHLRLQRLITENTPDRITQVPHFHDASGGRVAMRAYLPLQQRMEAVSVTFYDVGTGEPADQLWYGELEWDAAERRWRAPHGGTRILLDPESPGMRREEVPSDRPTPLQGSAEFLEMSLTARLSPGLSYTQVASLAAANPDNLYFRVLQHEMLTGPISAFVLLLLALPFSLRIARRTKSTVPGMVAMLGLAGLYFGAHFLVTSLAHGGEWNPAVLAWLPTVLFGSAALAAYATLDG
ncbi:MAG: LptF/LptG family permease [Planctomycetota bacterium]|nr:LptF/LptG family permease [Planctomycetota bacterium]